VVIRELLVTLGVKTDPKGFNKASASIGKLARSASLLGAALTTGALAIGFKKVVDLASDARETTGALDAIFGEERRKEIEQWSTSTAKAMGRSKFALEETASAFGAILKPMVGSADEAATMSKRLSELTVDLASLRNLTDKEAFEKLRSGIVGSSEPLLALGVDTRVAALEQFRMANGIKTAVKDMKPAAVTALRYQLILKKTADATGNAALTSGDFAGMSKRLAGVTRDLSTKFGNLLLPQAIKIAEALVAIVEATNTWLAQNEDLVDSIIDGVVRSLGVLGAIVKGTISVIGTVVGFVAELSSGFKLLGAVALAAWIIVSAPALAFALLLGLIGAAIFLVIDDLITMGEGGESVIGTLITGFQEWVKELGGIPQAIQKFISTAITFWVEGFADMFGASEDMAKNIGLLFTDTFNGIVNGFVESFKATVKSIKKILSFLGGGLALNLLPDVDQSDTKPFKLPTASLSAIQATSIGADSVLSPATSAASTSTSLQSNITSTANITVNTQPGANGAQIADEIESRVRQVNEQDRRAALDTFRPALASGT